MSEEKSIQARLNLVLNTQLGCTPEEITPDARFIQDLGADSLDVVELLMAVEEEFNIEIQDEDTGKLKTVSDATQYLEKHVS